MKLASRELIECYRARGWWTDTTIDALFRRWVRERPDELGLVDPPNREALTGGTPQRLSFAALGERVERLCGALCAAGLRRGDIVVMQLPNVVEHIELYLAGARLGLILSPLSTLARQFELRHALEVLHPRAIVSVARLKDARPADLALEVTGGSEIEVLAFGANPPAGARSLEALLAAQDARGPVARADAAHADADEIYTICWTSGTEGLPKAVPRSHNQWLAISWAHYDATGIGAGDRLLNPFPLINMASIGGCFTSWLHCGCALHLHHPLDLPVFLRQIATERITYTIAPPALLNMLLKDEQLASGADLSSLRCIGSGSAPLSEWMIRGFRERWGIEIVNLFGSNEGISLVTGPREAFDPAVRARYFPRFGRSDIRWEARIASMLETKLIDTDSGEEITAAGRAGELVARGPSIFSGYLGPESLTQAAFTPDGFYRTGDLFEIAGEGEEARFYRYVGRSKQIIVRGGLKISPDELDHLLAGHPQLAEAAVVGVADEIMGERVCAVAVPKPGAELTLRSLTDFLAAKGTAVYKLPERLVIAESLPRNAMGKIVRQQLAQIARERLQDAKSGA